MDKFDELFAQIKAEVGGEAQVASPPSVLRQRVEIPKEKVDLSPIKVAAVNAGKDIGMGVFDLLVATVFAIVHLVSSIREVTKK